MEHYLLLICGISAWISILQWVIEAVRIPVVILDIKRFLDDGVRIQNSPNVRIIYPAVHVYKTEVIKVLMTRVTPGGYTGD